MQIIKVIILFAIAVAAAPSAPAPGTNAVDATEAKRCAYNWIKREDSEGTEADTDSCPCC